MDFYCTQVLRDGRDDPYLTHRAQTESVTFLGRESENTRNLYAIPGLDYVAHEGRELLQGRSLTAQWCISPLNHISTGHILHNALIYIFRYHAIFNRG